MVVSEGLSLYRAGEVLYNITIHTPFIGLYRHTSNVDAAEVVVFNK